MTEPSNDDTTNDPTPAGDLGHRPPVEPAPAPVPEPQDPPA